MLSARSSGQVFWPALPLLAVALGSVLPVALGRERERAHEQNAHNLQLSSARKQATSQRQRGLRQSHGPANRARFA